MGCRVLNLKNVIAEYFPLICQSRRGIAWPTKLSTISRPLVDSQHNLIPEF
jgi:hypothetical protein